MVAQHLNRSSPDQLSALWSLALELSTELEQHRETASKLAKHASLLRRHPEAAAKRRARQDEANESSCAEDKPGDDRIGEIDVLEQRVEMLEEEKKDMLQLLDGYESAMEKVMSGLRSFAQERNAAMIEVHRTYAAQFVAQQQTVEELRASQADMQRRVAGISELIRETYESEAAVPNDALITALQVENEGLRAVCGVGGAG